MIERERQGERDLVELLEATCASRLSAATEPGGVRLYPFGKDIESLDAADVRRVFAADKAQSPLHAREPDAVPD